MRMSARASPYASIAVVCVLTGLPLVALFANGVQIFDIAHEFVAYRIGDALSMMFDD